MSFFEIGMLVCFGLAWPVSIWKTYTSRSNKGKSLQFLFVVFTGYIFGTLHKIFFSFDPVIFLYILNGIMVSIDIILYFRNERIAKKEKQEAAV